MKALSIPWSLRLGAILALPFIAGAWWLHASLKASLPPEGVVVLSEGVSTSASIERDADGVAHIRAGSDIDAFFAIGYAHAQDRLWQLELQRRIAGGRLSEIFGKASVETDVWFRTLGLYEAAEAALPALSGEARRSLAAYAAGINAWISEEHGLPVEFRVLGIEPEPWTEIDSLAWIKVFALDLGGNFRREMERHVARQSLDEARLSTLFPAYPAEAPTTVAAGADRDAEPLIALTGLQQQLERDYAIGGRNVGSNAWAVSGRHTNDGAALIANDPHLGLKIPSLWYLISVDAPSLKVSGMTLVGLPVVVFGRNAHIAWGGTNMMADTQDLYFERSDQSGERYEVNGEWVPFEIRTEKIHVRADFPSQLRRQYAPVTLEVRSTRHGPVISDYHGAFKQPVALRWTALDAGDTSYEAFFRLGYAQDWNAFKSALRYHVAPALNVVYIDGAGNIGYLGAGRIPIRRRGEGTLPSPGWDDAHAWDGHVPEDEWPQSFNPPSGYIVTANNKVAADEYPYFISHDWAPPARARRIEQLLRERIDAGLPLAIEDMQRIQGDTMDLDAAALSRELSRRVPQGEHAAQVAAYLDDWDGDMRADSQAAAIFTVWMRHFRERVFGDGLRGSWDNQEAGRVLQSLVDDVPLQSLRDMLQGEGSPWCGERAARERETCEDALAASLDGALWELHRLRGDWSMASWRWGEIQSTDYEHAFSDWKPLQGIFGRRIGNGGSENSINVAASERSGADGYLQKFGAGFRQIISLRGGRAVHYYMGSTGQSGNVMSPHYDDMVVPFRDVRLRKLESATDRNASAGTR